MCWQSGCCAEEEVGSAAQTVAQSAQCYCSNNSTKLCATAQTVVDIGSAAQTGEREASALHHR